MKNKILLLAFLLSASVMGARFQFTGLKYDITVTPSVGSTTFISKGSNQIQVFTGSQSQDVWMPPANTLVQGYWYKVYNAGTATITVRDGAGGSITTLSGGASAMVYVSGTSNAAGTWYASTAASASGTTYYLSQSTFGTDCSFTVVNQTSLTQWTADSSCTFTENVSSSGLTISAATSAGNKYGGITVTSWPATKKYRVSMCWNFETSVGGTTNLTFAIHDGSAVVGATSPADMAGNNINSSCITRLYSATAGATTTFAPQAISGGANTITVEGISTSTVVWIIEAANP